MKITFFHLADIHLGNHQYQLDERYNDFADAFMGIIEEAIRRKIDFVLVAGDIFHKRAIDAMTLYQAGQCFRRLRSAGIPVIVIEGNHDKAYYSDGSVSWLSYLKWTEKLVVLGPQFQDNEFRFFPWSDSELDGGYFDVPNTGVRIYGIPWAGAQTGRLIPLIADEIAKQRETSDDILYRILMLHTGLDGQVPNLHGLPTRAQFEPLECLVDYIALGHVHKPFAIDDWLYNPGSTETVSAEEWVWKRGYFDVTIDTDLPTAPRHVARHIENPKRPFIRQVFSVDGIIDPDIFYSRFSDFCIHLQPQVARVSKPPVIDIALRGVLPFEPGALDIHHLESLAKAIFIPSPLTVILRNQMSAFDATTNPVDFDSHDRTTWKALESRIFQDIFRNDSRFAPDAEAWSRILSEMKSHALEEDDPAAIATWFAAEKRKLDNSSS
jgi:exonuclease SbcD